MRQLREMWRRCEGAVRCIVHKRKPSRGLTGLGSPLLNQIDSEDDLNECDQNCSQGKSSRNDTLDGRQGP
jgi:hypothetical protein